MPIRIPQLTVPAKRNARVKYGHFACNTDLCAKSLPPSHRMEKSAVASLSVTSNSPGGCFLVGLSGGDSSWLTAAGLGVSGTAANFSSLEFIVTNCSAAIVVASWYDVGCICNVELVMRAWLIARRDRSRIVQSRISESYYATTNPMVEV